MRTALIVLLSFALGAFARGEYQTYKDDRAERSKPPGTREMALVCMHYRAIGQAFKCPRA